MFVNKLQEKRVFHLTPDPVSLDACSHTEIWDSIAAYKYGLEREKKKTLNLCSFSVQTLQYFSETI